LTADHLPLFDILYSTGKELIMTIGAEAEALDLPGFLVGICNNPYNFLILDIDHYYLTNHVDCYTVDN
jgi:hypothetical protein